MSGSPKGAQCRVVAKNIMGFAFTCRKTKGHNGPHRDTHKGANW